MFAGKARSQHYSGRLYILQAVFATAVFFVKLTQGIGLDYKISGPQLIMYPKLLSLSYFNLSLTFVGPARSLPL
jgi:hypothetical protein